MLPLFILIPLAALILLNLPLRVLQKAAICVGGTLALAQTGVVLLAPESFWAQKDFILSPLLSLNLSVGQNPSLCKVLLLSIGIVMFVTFLVGQQTVSDEKKRFNFFSLLLVATIGMNGMVLLSDLFSLYVFMEIISVSSFVMIALDREPGGLEGAFKYLVLSAVATVLMLSAVSLLMLVSSGVSYDAVSAALADAKGNALAKIAVGVFVCGLFIKGGLVPFHGWLPAAYSKAPAAVSVFLAGIATKVTGIYALIRLTTTVFAHDAQVGMLMMAVGALSIVVGAVVALKQDDFKTMLAYSSISQVGYIILGLGCAVALPAGSDIGKLALAGAIFHLFNHAIFKSLLFVNSAALEQRLGTTDMNRMLGLGTKMPFTSTTAGIAVLSTAGIPPLSGFWSKLIVVIALWQGGFHAYAAIAIVASVITLAYFLTMLRRVFFGKAQGELPAGEASAALVVPAVVLAAITIALGVFFPYIFNTFLLPLSKIL